MVDHHLPHDLIARNWTEVTHFDANPRNVFFHDFPIVCLEIPKLWMPQIHEHPIFIQLCFTIDPTRHQRLKETAMRGVPLFPNADVGDRLLLVGQPSLSASCGPLNLLEFGKHWEVWGLTSTNWKFDFRKIRQPHPSWPVTESLHHNARLFQELILNLASPACLVAACQIH